MTKRSRSAGPAPIQEILAKILKPRDLRQLELYARLRQAWEEHVSDSIRGHTRLLDFQKKCLLVGAASHAWVQELHFHKPRILAALQRQLGEKQIKDIQFLLSDETASETEAAEV